MVPVRTVTFWLSAVSANTSREVIPMTPSSEPVPASAAGGRTMDGVLSAKAPESPAVALRAPVTSEPVAVSAEAMPVPGVPSVPVLASDWVMPADGVPSVPVAVSAEAMPVPGVPSVPVPVSVPLGPTAVSASLPVAASDWVIPAEGVPSVPVAVSHAEVKPELGVT